MYNYKRDTIIYNGQMQRDIAQEQHRAYHRQRRGYYGGGFSGLFMLMIFLVLLSHTFWILFALVLFGLPFFLFALLLFSATNQPPLYVQPYQQYQPLYQPYTQGYQPQQPVSRPEEPYQESNQQYVEQPQQTQQYEEPLTMYPQE